MNDFMAARPEEVPRDATLTGLTLDSVAQVRLPMLEFLPHLTLLRLQHCDDVEEDGFETHEGIRCIVVSNCGVCSLDWLDSFPELQSLRIEHCDHIGEYLPVIPRCTPAELVLRGLGIHSIENLPGGPGCLQRLTIASCFHITDFSPLRAVTGLVFLDIHDTAITTVEWIGRLQQLQVLYLSHNPSLCDEGLFYLAMLPNLVKLDLSATPIASIEWVAGCSGLTHFMLRSCRGIADFSRLRSLPRLVSLYLSDTLVDSLDWVDGCPQLQYLDLDHCEHLRDGSPLRRLPMLQSLDVYSGGMRDLQWLIECRVLRSVRLTSFRSLHAA